MDYLQVFAKNLKEIRRSKNLSQSEFAGMIRVAGSYINALESGTRNPSLKSIVKVATALGVSPEVLLKISSQYAKKKTYPYILGLLEKEMMQWKGKKWYHQRFDGSPYFLHLIGEAETYTHKFMGGEYGFRVHYCFFENEGADWYILQDDIEKVSKKFIENIRQDASYCLRIMKEWQESEERLDQIFEDFGKIVWARLSDEELLEKNELLLDVAVERFSSSSLIDGFSLGSDVFLEARLKNIYTRSKEGKRFSEFFSLMTAPTRVSFINQAEIDMLVCAEKIRQYPEKQREYIAEYQKKYFWIRNNYIHAHELSYEYFELEIMRLVAGNDDLVAKSEKLRLAPKKSRLQKRCIEDSVSIDKFTRNLLDATDRFTYWQDERKKDTMLCGHFLTKILQEVSHRTNIPLHLLKFISPRSLREAFSKSKEVTRELQKASNEACVLYWTREGHERISGNLVVHRIKGSILSQQSIEESEDFRGMSASSGKAVGVARIIKNVRDIDKVRNGDVLVAIMTRPDYVPGMKRAAGIVTNEGGITCHAAIISRELGKPCIIGTRVATQMIHDGDIVEVNANHGVVRILKRKKK